MRASFMLPSCNYNIHLSREDLTRLLETGHIGVLVYRDVPCKTGRGIISEDRSFKTLDRKTIPNNLRFYLEEDVADIEGGDWHVQFLTINLDGGPLKEEA